jgi:hypothetical protein
MVSKEELKDILHKEEVQAIWDSTPKNSENIRRAEADEKFWKEQLHPYYDEMFAHTPAKTVSDVVKKEVDEYKENDPIFDQFDMIEGMGIIAIASMGLFWCVIGLISLIFILTAGYEESCLSC